MSVAELKQLVHQRVEQLQEPTSLQEILSHLDQIENAVSEKSYNLSRHYEALSKERADLLRKLAQ